MANVSIYNKKGKLSFQLIKLNQINIKRWAHIESNGIK